MPSGRRREGLLTLDEALQSLERLNRAPLTIEPAVRVLHAAFEIACKYDRAVYDSLFVALARDLGLQGVTADERLYNAIHPDFPNIILLRNF